MPENAVPQNAVPPSAAPENAVPQNAVVDTAPAPGDMSLYAAMLGEAGGPLGRVLEGMMTAQVASVLARLGVADELADGPAHGQASWPSGWAPPPTHCPGCWPRRPSTGWCARTPRGGSR